MKHKRDNLKRVENFIQYNTIQYNTIQYNTIQYNKYTGSPFGAFQNLFTNICTVEVR